MKAARNVFRKAREDPRTGNQVYVAAAMMEFHCSKDPNIAFKIFELGLKVRTCVQYPCCSVATVHNMYVCVRMYHTRYFKCTYCIILYVLYVLSV